MLILGAGLSGCIAGVLNQEAVIYEAGTSETGHQAVLRFRSPDVGDAVGINFNKVKVYKGVYVNDKFVLPDIRMMNQYSLKVTGGLFDRSIANLETEERWIAPEGFHNMLKEICKGRIYFNHQVESRLMLDDHKVISTIPIYELAKIYDIALDFDIPTRIKEIYVSKFCIKDANLQQTIYFPDPEIDVYRATMTGDILRIESKSEILMSEENYVLNAFGIYYSDTEELITNHHQEFGKLLPMDEQKRRNFIRKMSRDFKVYSLGRFATWRNILLDDVLYDIGRIRKMMNQDEYEFSKELI